MKIDKQQECFCFGWHKQKSAKFKCVLQTSKRSAAGHTSLKLSYFVLREIKGNRASKLKKGLFNVERVPKGIFWGETYFLDFYKNISLF